MSWPGAKFVRGLDVQLPEILAICCLDLPVSDYESVRINNLCHKMTLHRI